jgi:hypothetical protein
VEDDGKGKGGIGSGSSGLCGAPQRSDRHPHMVNVKMSRKELKKEIISLIAAKSPLVTFVDPIGAKKDPDWQFFEEILYCGDAYGFVRCKDCSKIISVKDSGNNHSQHRKSFCKSEQMKMIAVKNSSVISMKKAVPCFAERQEFHQQVTDLGLTCGFSFNGLASDKFKEFCLWISQRTVLF